jgi:DNA-binding NarL/FixJ family response regulator
VIRVEVESPDEAMRRDLEAVIASSSGVMLAAHDGDVLLAAAPLEDLEPGPPIVLMAQPAWTPQALRLGVRAMLPPDAPSAEIVAALYSAANGLAVVEPRELEGWLATLTPPPVSETGPLTPRELEVLRMMAEGAANKTIAWKLEISEHTAKFHVASILAKLNAGTRTEAVTQGVRRGLILL